MSEEEEQNRFSLRKLSIGLASVLVGVSIFGTSQTVKADTVANNQTSSVTNNAKSSDTQENKNVAKSSFSNDNQANNAKSNLIQTQVEGKKDQKQDSAPKTQEVNDGSNLDAEKSIVRTSSLQEPDNQSNNHAKDNSQTQNEQKLDLTKNSPKFTKKVLATNLIATPPMTNGGFDPKIWGTMDTSKWQLDNNGNITGYTGDMSHIIIPNSADFAQAGKSYQQISISSDEMEKLGSNANSKADTLAISLTDNQKVKAINANWNSIFRNTLLKQANLEGLDTSNVTNMNDMFYNASSLTSLDVSNWKTGKVTDMSGMFSYDSSLTNLDVSNWNTGNVTDMHWMFYNASSLTSLDVSKWDTGNVTDMSWMFQGTSGLMSLDVSKWDTSNVIDMKAMFYSASGLTNLDVSKWDTGNVTDMDAMFDGASSLTSLDVSKWNTGKVTDMDWMFGSASSLTSLDVSDWDTGNVNNMNGMFNGASGLTSLDVSKWKTGKVTNMSWMFDGASRLTNLDVSKWDTSKVTNMKHMFSDASGLTSLDVSNWDTGNVTDMSDMFNGASSLNSLDVSNWDTSNVTNMAEMFDSASSLTSLDVSKWTTGNVTNMYAMFSSDPKLALIINGDKFADYLVKNNFMGSGINSSVKSVTTDNAKLLQLLTNDVQHNSATRTIVLIFPANYSPDLAKYHLTKANDKYQIKQSADYNKSYVQGTVLINATDDITEHHIDTTKLNKLSDTWQPNYDKLVLAHKNSDGSVSFDAIQLPKIPGYKAHLVRNKINPAMLMVSFMAVPSENKPSLPNEETPSKPSAPVDNTNKPADDLKQRVVTELNSNDSGWTMPNTRPATYTVEVPDDNTINLSDLVIAEPVHAMSDTIQIPVTKRFKLSKKHSIKHLKHRKKAVRTFKKYRL